MIVVVANLQLAAHVELNTPEGGETYYSGDMVTIIWTETVSHKTLDWDLLFSNDGGQTWISLKFYRSIHHWYPGSKKAG